MVEFEYDGKRYQFDSNKCYNHNGCVLLPDGRVLLVNDWFETYPPKPTGFSNPGYLPGMIPEGTVEAEEVK